MAAGAGWDAGSAMAGTSWGAGWGSGLGSGLAMAATSVAGAGFEAMEAVAVSGDVSVGAAPSDSELLEAAAGTLAVVCVVSPATFASPPSEAGTWGTRSTSCISREVR